MASSLWGNQSVCTYPIMTAALFNLQECQGASIHIKVAFLLWSHKYHQHCLEKVQHTIPDSQIKQIIIYKITPGTNFIELLSRKKKCLPEKFA